MPGIEIPKESPIFALQSFVQGATGGGVLEQLQCGPLLLIVTVTGGAQPLGEIGVFEGWDV